MPDGWLQEHKQQMVDDDALVGAQLLIGAAHSHGWKSPIQKVPLEEELGKCSGGSYLI